MRQPPSAEYRAVCERLFRQNEFAVKLGLERMRAALAAEGVGQPDFIVVLVAGTNGKGSVCSLMHAALVDVGLRVGLYTSPHLVEVRERLRVNGEPIGEADFVRLAGDAIARWGDEGAPLERRLTYFELVTLVAARWFAEKGVDIGLFEVGLGGRLDACNALEPTLSVITRVALDHEKYLGDTLASVFAEKAGVLRAGRPAVVCRPAGWSPVETRAALAAHGPEPLSLEGESFGADGRLWAGGTELDEGWIPFAGAHQRANAACAVEALLCLAEATPEEGYERLESPASPLAPGSAGVSPARRPAATQPATWCRLAARARWPGRWQRVEWAGRAVWLDAAHNPNGAAAAAAELGHRFAEPVTLVMAALADKRVDEMLASLAPRAARLIAAPLNNPRALAPVELAVRARAAGLESHVAASLSEALDRAAADPSPIVALGSLYLLGGILHLLGYRAEDLAVLG